MTLRDPETRKGLRAVVGAIIALALIALVWWSVARIAGEQLAALLTLSLYIVALRVLFDGAENVTNAFKFRADASGFEADFGAVQGAKRVAQAATDEADHIEQGQS